MLVTRVLNSNINFGMPWKQQLVGENNRISQDMYNMIKSQVAGKSSRGLELVNQIDEASPYHDVYFLKNTGKGKPPKLSAIGTSVYVNSIDIPIIKKDITTALQKLAKRIDAETKSMWEFTQFSEKINKVSK